MDHYFPLDPRIPAMAFGGLYPPNIAIILFFLLVLGLSGPVFAQCSKATVDSKLYSW